MTVADATRENFHELVAQLSLTTDLERNYEHAELQVLEALKKLGGAATARTGRVQSPSAEGGTDPSSEASRAARA